jgi:uncharacterized NAD(P)/FAD-binding protein YdhS
MPIDTNPQPPRRHARNATIAIVGAGFSGTALAWRLLRTEGFRGRVVLVERSGRFGPGLAYGAARPRAVLNVPAGNMSLDERQPADFLDFLESQGCAAGAHEFVPRQLYGRYLETRLDEVARSGTTRGRLLRVTGEVTSLARADDGFVVTIGSGQRLFADRIVLATGHSPPATLPSLSRLEGTSTYVRNPWATLPPCRPGGRVLIVGTGLTMADVVCELVDRPDGPAQIVAVSRHGRLPHVRDAAQLRCGDSQSPRAVEAAADARGVVAAVRRAARDAQARGGSWRDVIAGVRAEAPRLWGRLSVAERRRLLRHAQSFWDVHRHLLPPQVGETVHAALRARRLEVLGARIVAAEPRSLGARMTLQRRGESRHESLDVDQVILCTGPSTDPRRSPSPLVRELVALGWLTADPTGHGLRVDAQGRPIDCNGTAVDGIHYLGPWLRARDWEATAVAELRGLATALADTLLDAATPAIRSCRSVA